MLVKENEKEKLNMDIQQAREKYGLDGLSPKKVEKWLKYKEYFEQFTVLEYEEFKSKCKEIGSTPTYILSVVQFIPNLKVMLNCTRCGQEAELNWGILMDRGGERLNNEWLSHFFCPDCYAEYLKEMERRKIRFAEFTGEGKQIEDCYVHWGIYGIKMGEEMVYVGYTQDDFRVAWLRHESMMRNPKIETPQQNYLYKAMRENEYEFVVLLDITKLNNNMDYKKRDLECMKLMAINIYKPKFNYEGVKTPYKHGRHRGKKN
jgi:hypothetical protein